MTVKNVAHGYVLPSKKGKRRILWHKLAGSFIIALGFIYGTVTFISQVVQKYPEWIEKHHEQLVDNQYEKIKVTIQEGDTAWKIQQQLTPHEDVRIPLDLAKSLKENKDIDWGNLKPGQTVVFLKEKKSSD